MAYPGALSVLRQEWRMSASQAGAIASGFQIGYAVSLVIFSSIADRISPKRIYLWSMFAAAVSALGFAFFARDFTSAIILHTTVGVALGGTYTVGLMIISDQYAIRSRGMAVGFFIASTSFGYACSLGISGIALSYGGYRLSFLLTCLGPTLGWLLALVALWRTSVPTAMRQKGQKFTREVLGNRPAMLLIWGYTFHNWELQGMWSWTPAFMASCIGLWGMTGLKAAGAGAYIAASFHLVGLLASFSMGTLSDRLGRSRVMLALAIAGTACSFLFGWSFTWPLALVIAIGMVYAFSALGDSPILSAALTEVVDTAYLGSALGFRSLVGFGAAAAAPLAFGAILDLSNPGAGGQQGQTEWGWAFSVLGLGGLGAVWAIFRFARFRASRQSAGIRPGTS
jgi:MFS family permease